MKKIHLFMLLALCLPLSVMAKDADSTRVKDRSVYLELLGASTMVGINYDARFNDHTRWGWRAGLGFAYTDQDGFYVGSTSTRGWGVPIDINYLVGSRKNNLELGIGANVGIYNIHYNDYSFQKTDEATFNNVTLNGGSGVAWKVSTGDGQYYLVYRNNKSKNRFGYYLFGDVGYRHVANSGFLFRVGLSPSYNFGDKHAVCRGITDGFHKFAMSIYLGFGWVF